MTPAEAKARLDELMLISDWLTDNGYANWLTYIYRRVAELEPQAVDKSIDLVDQLTDN